MSEFITHVPNQEELQRWSAERAAQAQINVPQNFEYGIDDFTRNRLQAHREAVESDETLDPATKQSIAEILTQGTLNGNKIGLTDVIRNGVSEGFEREYIASIMQKGEMGKTAAEAIVETGVCGFHSTRSQALAGMLEHGGLIATTKLVEKGVPVITGEHFYQSAEGQGSISFSNLAETKEVANIHAGEHGVKIRDYETVRGDMIAAIDQIHTFKDSEIFSDDKVEAMIERHKHALDKFTEDPDSLFTALNMHEFPVMVGISKDYLIESEERRTSGRLVTGGGAHTGEFRPLDDEISLDHLPVVAVPEIMIAPVQELFKMFGHPKTRVVSFEALAA